jgi:hypothetical protein
MATSAIVPGTAVGPLGWAGTWAGTWALVGQPRWPLQNGASGRRELTRWWPWLGRPGGRSKTGADGSNGKLPGAASGLGKS